MLQKGTMKLLALREPLPELEELMRGQGPRQNQHLAIPVLMAIIWFVRTEKFWILVFLGDKHHESRGGREIFGHIHSRSECCECQASLVTSSILR